LSEKLTITLEKLEVFGEQLAFKTSQKKRLFKERMRLQHQLLKRQRMLWIKILEESRNMISNQLQ
jgi:hypothetical protein